VPPATIATIGYEGATIPALLQALGDARVQLLVDVRAVASSRRPGVAKTRLAAHLAAAGIEYRHLRGLGTPADGRAAARAGRYEELRAVYLGHLTTLAAQGELHELADLAANRRVALLCFEADPAHCHRSMIAAALGEIMPLDVQHLRPQGE
jgi:uncharacterized protein (DUF488 family)